MKQFKGSVKKVLLCVLFLGLTSTIFSQDTTKLRLERFETLRRTLRELHTNTNKTISMYKKYMFISPETYKDLKSKAEQFGKSLKTRTAPDHFYIRKLGDNYNDLTQLINSIYDSVHPTSRIPKTKGVIKKFFNSYFKAEDAIYLYDDLNWSDPDLLFKAYRQRHPTAI